MSLAEELLADLEDDADVEEEVEDLPGDGEMVDVTDETLAQIDVSADSINHIAKLRNSKLMKDVLAQIEEYYEQQRSDFAGPVEADPEYKLIVDANNLAVEIENEINIIHKFCRDKYSKRFPELESLVPVALEYVSTINELGNDLDKAKNNEILLQFLTPATIMVVSVTASTTQGQHLSQDQLDRITEACNMALDLNERKQRVFEYVESRMHFFAPNVTAIVGASTAAKMMGVAGGLTVLSKMPACNVMLLGSQRKSLSGFSTTAILPHTGFLYYCQLIQDTPPDLRRKGTRLLAAKVAMASRVDSFHQSSDGQYGRSLREDIERKLDKMQEPPPVKQIKALPAPIDQPRKRRGGKRVRKMKERIGLTEFRKQANRMTFAEIEQDAYQDDLGMSMGQVGSKSASGRIRAPQVDEKTKVRISKTLQRNMQKQQQYGGSTTVKKAISGTASSVAFTPLQGLEIVNPQAAEKRISEANAKYFSSTASFVKSST